MKKFLISTLMATSFVATTTLAQNDYPRTRDEDKDGIFSDKYWSIWEAEMPRIDADIEKYRKADAIVKLDDVLENSDVKIRQISSDFKFGAPALYWNRAGTPERNKTYRELWGTLFNQATIGFYWKQFEIKEGKLRFKSQMWDTEEFLNTLDNTSDLPTAFNPATDEVVEYMSLRGIRIHGHPLMWGNKRWHLPETEWIFNKYANPEAKNILSKKLTFSKRYSQIPTYVDDKYRKMSQEEADKNFGVYAENIQMLANRRIKEIAEHYKDKIASWDVVNESTIDYERKELKQTGKVCMSTDYGIMPADYTFRTFKFAEKTFPKNVVLSINDWNLKPAYAKQIKELVERGAKVDMIGVQEHQWNMDRVKKIAAGEETAHWIPEKQRAIFESLTPLNIPIHVSEVTILPTERTPKGFKAQATVARNFYKLWFSQKNVVAITYWRTIDKIDENIKNPDEPFFGGVLTPEAMKKPIYYMFDELFNKEWRTNIITKSDESGTLKFRGFKGDYEIEYIDKKNNLKVKKISVR